jgi:hypothetical protein
VGFEKVRTVIVRPNVNAILGRGIGDRERGALERKRERDGSRKILGFVANRK